MDVATAQKLWDPEPGWLNTATYGLPPRPAFEQVRAALDDWRVGRASWVPWGEPTVRARAAFARLIGVHPDDVAIGSTASQLLAPIAAALPAGTRVLAPDVEFTSNLYPWAAAPGVEVRTVPADRLAESVDARTDLVAFSLVQSATGAVADYAAVVAAARDHGALVVVDASQACGWLPFDGGRADAVVVVGFKWLMSPHGSAFAYLSPALRERLTPYAAGRFAAEEVQESLYGLPLRLAATARRFDISPAWFSWVGTASALELVEEIGVERIGAHDVALANRFLAGLGQPPGDSAIVTVDVPGAQERLARAGVRAAVRAGRVRASFHVYSTPADVDLAVEALTGV